MSINPPSYRNDNEPLPRGSSCVEALQAVWRDMPPPVKLLADAVAVALAAPALRRAADTLGVEPKELLRLIQRT